MSPPESEKAVRYIDLLNTARLNGAWGEVPELARKVDKHAPYRKCLTTTALAEVQIAAASKQRPTTSDSTSSHVGLLDVTPKLVQVIDDEKTFFEDAFQANVSLHEIYFLRGEWSTIAGGLRGDVWQQVAKNTQGVATISANTRIAILKNRYFLAVAQEQHGHAAEAAESYASAVKACTDAPKDVTAAPEFRHWAESVLGRSCLLHGSTSTKEEAVAALASFKMWADFWDQAPTAASSALSRVRSDPFGHHDVSRRKVWAQYYHLISLILANGLVYSATQNALLPCDSNALTPSELHALRLQQRTEFKRVEATYEALILQETQFPKASQSNEEVESWTQHVVANWRIFCGSGWTDRELGEGGKTGVSRGVLDILYRAATKTFHSTPILRQLFMLHASLAEFELAMRAFDTYSEIITKGKARVEKTGEDDLGLDSDELVIFTAAQAIRLLCRYGCRAQSEKAVDISHRLTVWLAHQRPKSSDGGVKEMTTSEALLSQHALEAAHRAIGESQANWARITYDPVQRREARAHAVLSLRKASDLASPPGSNPDTALLYATVLAETRELLPAIQVIKKAIALFSQVADAVDDDESATATLPNADGREQKLASLWHLLSLLLTARGEHENAVKVCEAAFDQLESLTLLMDEHADAADTNADASQQCAQAAQAAIDAIEDGEKETLLQIRTTQLALLEVLEGPTAAVDASSTLLALYTKLYGSPSTAAPAPQKTVALAAPTPVQKTGTLKSISGSILGRKSTRKSLDRSTFEKTNTATTEPEQPVVGAPITIQVTKEDGQTAAEPHKHMHIPHHPFKLHGHHGSETGNLRPSTQQPEKAEAHNGAVAASNMDEKSMPAQPLREVQHNIDHSDTPAPLGHHDQPPRQDLRLPAPHPATRGGGSLQPRFPSAQQNRHRISLLVDIWLFIAGQYLRAELFEDAGGAIDEAQKLVESFQNDLAKEESSARAFNERGWGSGKSVNRLWADVYAERATLAQSQSLPHPALSAYEHSLAYFPDHPAAVVGLSQLLLDMYEQKIPAELSPTPALPATAMPAFSTPLTTSSSPSSTAAAGASATGAAAAPEPSPALLNRLAARDRAHMLLGTLTRLGEGWDDSEAWMALARAHELAEQVERARECLWWVVELEDGRPLRPWGVVCA